MNFNRCLVIALTIVTLVPLAPQSVDAARREARAILAREVGAIAKKTVVRIEASDGSFGSGVIIGRTEKGNKNIYTILTAEHVVRSPNRKYQLVMPIPLDTNDKKRVKIDFDAQNKIAKLPNVDLATISVESNRIFAIGTIGNSEYVDEGSPVYVAGFPMPGQAIKRIAFQFTGGMVSSRLDESEIDPQNSNNGYDISYTNVTRAGMSGGPVFDAAGRIVAIHGRGDRNNQGLESSASSVPTNDEKTGFNLGIPIQTFLKLRPQAPKTVGAKIDKSPLNYQLSDGSVTIGTSNRKFIQKIRVRGESSPVIDVTKVNEQTED